MDFLSLIILCLGVSGAGALGCVFLGPVLRERTAWVAVATALAALVCVVGVAIGHTPGSQVSVSELVCSLGKV